MASCELDDTLGLIKDLGSPSDTALNSMSLALSLVIEKIYWEHEIRIHNHIQLTIPNTSSTSLDSSKEMSGYILDTSVQAEAKPYSVWKKILLLTAAIFYSLALGILKFMAGDHTFNQIVFGWLLGAWIALVYFNILRDRVH